MKTRIQDGCSFSVVLSCIAVLGSICEVVYTLTHEINIEFDLFVNAATVLQSHLRDLLCLGRGCGHECINLLPLYGN